MKKRKSMVLGLFASAAVLLVVAAALITIRFSVQKNGYSRYITRAEKYVTEQKYELAEVSYQKAIQSNPERAEAYIGLISVYSTEGKTVAAHSVYLLGVQRTSSAQLVLLGEKMFDDDVASENLATETSAEKLASDGGLNLALLGQLGQNTYNDYRLRTGISGAALQDDGFLQLRADGLNALLSFAPEQLNAGMPSADSFPKAIFLDRIADLWGGMDRMTLDQLRATHATGTVLTESAEHGYLVTFRAGDCTVSIAADADGNMSGNAWNVIVPDAANEEEKAKGESSIAGTVINAVTGESVPRAEIKCYQGSAVGTPLQTLSCDSFGKYSVDLAPGNYTLIISASGFQSENFTVYVGSSASAKDFVISPTLAQGEIRIVLEWGANPRDLDSWLTGTTDGGKNVRVSYMNKSVAADGKKIAELDVDNTSGYGPETTTIYDINGVYRFSVVDYTRSGNISASGATVKIYTPGNASPTIVNICSGLTEGWSVCVIDHGNVSVTNTSCATNNRNLA